MCSGGGLSSRRIAQCDQPKVRQFFLAGDKAGRAECQFHAREVGGVFVFEVEASRYAGCTTGGGVGPCLLSQATRNIPSRIRRQNGQPGLMIPWTCSQAEECQVSHAFRCDCIQVIELDEHDAWATWAHNHVMFCPGCFVEYGSYAGPQAVNRYVSLEGFLAAVAGGYREVVG
jgi:hypothetical protein